VKRGKESAYSYVSTVDWDIFMVRYFRTWEKASNRKVDRLLAISVTEMSELKDIRDITTLKSRRFSVFVLYSYESTRP